MKVLIQATRADLEQAQCTEEHLRAGIAKLLGTALIPLDDEEGSGVFLANVDVDIVVHEALGTPAASFGEEPHAQSPHSHPTEGGDSADAAKALADELRAARPEELLDSDGGVSALHSTSTAMGDANTAAQGAWVCDGERVARVKEVYPPDGKYGPMYDLVLYARDGTRIGRASPALGGPRDFEPCCDADGWREIERPRFPLERYEYMRNLVTYKEPSNG